MLNKQLSRIIIIRSQPKGWISNSQCLIGSAVEQNASSWMDASRGHLTPEIND
jgi:hypothetical protein